MCSYCCLLTPIQHNVTLLLCSYIVTGNRRHYSTPIPYKLSIRVITTHFSYRFTCMPRAYHLSNFFFLELSFMAPKWSRKAKTIIDTGVDKLTGETDACHHSVDEVLYHSCSWMHYSGNMTITQSITHIF